ncbi:C4-dicarboxylate TRAP transporter substrate-binding protein [Brevibacterium daeguense]|uniref:C4-dicarboxylate TRAP transporter substrate-binding protein n=1 Tax=Brevibacterium daeguense TaxID=909936 RepID=A0ABP8EFM3_9MICO|nr:TRAP transporter substrate-binding protein DctP [Brevibacterium daeguense]
MSNRVRTAVGAAAAAGLALSLTACGGVSGAAEGELAAWQGANYMPEQNSFSRAVVEVADFIEEQEIAQVEVFHQESLLGASDILPGIADGRANMGIINPFYYPGELPLTNVASVPFMSQDPWAHTTALNEVYDNSEQLKAEYEKAGVELITFVPVATTILGAKDEMNSLDDFKGKKIRSVGLLSNAMSEVGANPVSMPAGEIYQSMEQGVIDGYTSYPFDIAVSNSLHEVAPVAIDPGTGVYSVGAILMNKGDWDALTDEQRTALDENSRTFADSAAQMVADDLESLCGTFLEAGGTPAALPDDEIKKFKDTVGDSLIESWKSEAVKAGVEEGDVDNFLEALQAGIEKYEAESEKDLSVRPCIEQAG